MNNFTRITYGRKSSVPENAALLSFRHAFSLPEAAKKEAVRDALIGVFQKLIPSVSQNGIILGHLKGSIQAGGALLGLSPPGPMPSIRLPAPAGRNWTLCRILKSESVCCPSHPVRLRRNRWRK